MFVEASAVRINRPTRPTVPVEPVLCRAELKEQALRDGYQEGVAQGRAEGLRAGHEEGLEKGRADAAMQAESAIRQAIAAADAATQQQEAQLRELLRTLSAAAHECRTAAEDEMVALCFDTICRVLGEVAVQPETVRLHLAQALAMVRSQPAVVLHVHPQDAVLLQEAALSPGPVQPGRLVEWMADPQVSLGGCIVEAGSSSLDVRLETTVESLKSALRLARARRAASAKAAA
jgi:flagellar assembly protein FliH